MAASANPSGNQEGSHVAAAGSAGGNPSNSISGAVSDNSVPAHATHELKHNPGLSVEWTAEEQSILDEGLAKYVSESNIVRYAKISMQLQDKTVRDVALRCRWLTKKESGKRRKEDHSLTRKNKDKKEKVMDPSKSSSHLAARQNVTPYAVPMIPVDNDDGISYKDIGGITGELLEQNAQVFNQISANLANYQLQDNIKLFCQVRDNILTILDDLNDMPGVMKQMPSLPVKINEELANTILPRTTHPMQQT